MREDDKNITNFTKNKPPKYATKRTTGDGKGSIYV
jgi:hypothetical protein